MKQKVRRIAGRPPDSQGRLDVLEELVRTGQGSASSLSDKPVLDPHKKNIKKDHTRYDYKTVHSHLRSLENDGSIRRKFDPGRLGRSQEIIFEPTLLGLVRYLAARQPTAETVKKLAQDYERMLPSVFRKWSYFQNFKPPPEQFWLVGIHPVDAIVCKALNHAANEVVGTHPANVAFAFDIDELARTRNGWQSDPYVRFFRTVDDYIEAELRLIIEPKALLLQEMLHPYPWDDAQIAAARGKSFFASMEPELLWSAIAGDVELRGFAIEWLWHQKLESIEEAKRTDLMESHLLNPTTHSFPFKEEIESPTSIEILLWEYHRSKIHGSAQRLVGGESSGIARMYPKAEDLKSCSICGKKTSEMLPPWRYGKVPGDWEA